MTPSLICTTECAALCTYCTMWSNADVQYTAANGRATILNQWKHALFPPNRPMKASSVP